jgi:transcriptional regulator with XRE-family HTH domain
MAFAASSASPQFGTILRTFRRAAGLSQEDLAALAGLSTHAVGDLERGYRYRPRQETVTLLREALQLNQEDQILFEAAARRAGRRVRDTVTPPLYDDHCLLPPFIGRATEWTRCERYLAGEENPLLFIAGEPGVGKTRLLCEIGSRAFARGWGVLAARCRRGGESYGPLLDLIVRAIRRQTPAERRANLRGCAWLGSVLPELVEILPAPVPSWPLGREAERRLVTAAITRFLTNMAGPAGTLLLLDDSHLADGDTLELLPHLVRATTDEDNSLAIRVIGTYRSTEVDSRTGFMRQLADLMQMQAACHLSLVPLSAAEASALLEHLLPDTDTGAALRRRSRDQVRVRSGGVPFFLVHCAEQLRLTLDAPETVTLRPDCRDAVAEARHCQGQPLPVPWIVAESIRQRLAELPAAGYDAVQIVALAGYSLSDTLLLKVLRLAGHTEEQAVFGVEAAGYARLLLEREGPAYAFAHPVIGDVVTSNISAARRMLLRRRFGEACEALKPLRQRREEHHMCVEIHARERA